MDQYSSELWKELSEGFDRSSYRSEGKKQHNNKKPGFWIHVMAGLGSNDFDDTEFAMRIWLSFKDTKPSSQEVVHFVSLGYSKLPQFIANMLWEMFIESKPSVETMKKVASGMNVIYGGNTEPKNVRALNWILDRDQHYSTLGYVDRETTGLRVRFTGTEAEMLATKERLQMLWNEKYPSTLRIVKRVPVTPIWDFKEALEKGNYTRGDLEAGLNPTIRQWFVEGGWLRQHCYSHLPIRTCEEAGSDKPAEIYLLEQCRFLKPQGKERGNWVVVREMDQMGLRPAPAGYLFGYAVKDWDIAGGERDVYALGTRCWVEDDEYPIGKRPFYLGLEKWMTSPGSADECRRGTHIRKELRAIASIYPDSWTVQGLGHFYLALRKDTKIEGKLSAEKHDPGLR